MTNNKCQIDYSYLRPKKAAALMDWGLCTFEKMTKLEVWAGENATILPLKRFSEDNLLFGRAGVIDADGEYVNLSAIERRVQHAYPVHDSEYRDERVIYCGYLVKHWGHFLVEAVARLWYALESTDKLIFVTDEGKENGLTGNYKEFFELLGVYDRVEIINKPTCFREVVVPQLGYKTNAYFSDEYRSIFSRIADNVDTPDGWTGPEKIYLSRSHLKGVSRKESGHDMLDNYFAKNGYQVIHPQELSLSGLILLLKHCSECAAFSGTLPHNMLFAPDGSKLIIVERYALNNEIQLDVNRMKYLDVTYIDANMTIYPVGVGFGPFIMVYNEQMDTFTKDRGYCSPDAKYLSRKYAKKEYATYMKAYRRFYRDQWYMENWMIKYTDSLYEAYSDSQKYFGDFASGRRPFAIRHYFMPHYWKQFLKRRLRH